MWSVDYDCFANQKILWKWTINAIISCLQEADQLEAEEEVVEVVLAYMYNTECFTVI